MLYILPKLIFAFRSYFYSIKMTLFFQFCFHFHFLDPAKWTSDKISEAQHIGKILQWIVVRFIYSATCSNCILFIIEKCMCVWDLGIVRKSSCDNWQVVCNNKTTKEITTSTNLILSVKYAPYVYQSKQCGFAFNFSISRIQSERKELIFIIFNGAGF